MDGTTAAVDGTTTSPGRPAPGQPDPGQPAPAQPAQFTPAQPAQFTPGQPAPGQPAPGQPAPGQPAPGQPDPGQPGPGQPAPGQPAPGQFTPVQPVPGQPAPGEPAPGPFAPGPPVPGQFMSGQFVPGVFVPGPFAAGQPALGLPAAGPAPGWPGQQRAASGLRRWLGGRALACARGLALCGLALTSVAALTALSLGVFGVLQLRGPGNPHGLVLLILAIAVIPASLLVMRWLAGVTRTLAAHWCGVPIQTPYRPLPAPAAQPAAGQQAGRGGPGARAGAGRQLTRRAWWLASDPATWRDLLWHVTNAAVGWVLAAVPAALLAGGLTVATLGLGLLTFGHTGHAARSLAIVVVSLAAAAAGLWSAPGMLAGYGRLARSLLGPTASTELLLRVDHLAQTRSESLDTGAAEMRRIERDLHDGAQARLVATGMALDAAEQLLDTSPAAARALLAEARESAARALAELRDLVRGIHPPVLADRGLADAVQAMALDLPLPVHFRTELTGRPPAPVESASYFAVSELLANVSKHAAARQAWIDIWYAAGALRISVSDDGTGGADPARGTGLRGIERRLAAFDGVLAVSSPAGGPTVANIEVPCPLGVLPGPAAAAGPGAAGYHASWLIPHRPPRACGSRGCRGCRATSGSRCSPTCSPNTPSSFPSCWTTR